MMGVGYTSLAYFNTLLLLIVILFSVNLVGLVPFVFEQKFTDVQVLDIIFAPSYLI